MQQTTNYNLNKFDSTDELESATRLGLNENADTIDTALKGIQDDIDGLDAADVSYDNTVSGLTATDVQAAIDEELDKIDILSTDFIVEQGTDGIWAYEKWNSGKAVCWGTTSPSQTSVSSQWGGLYASGSSSTGNTLFPTGLFIEKPILLPSIYSTNYGCFIDEGETTLSNNLTKDQTGDIGLLRGTVASSLTISFGFYAIGKWK